MTHTQCSNCVCVFARNGASTWKAETKRERRRANDMEWHRALWADVRVVGIECDRMGDEETERDKVNAPFSSEMKTKTQQARAEAKAAEKNVHTYEEWGEKTTSKNKTFALCCVAKQQSVAFLYFFLFFAPM